MHKNLGGQESSLNKENEKSRCNIRIHALEFGWIRLRLKICAIASDWVRILQANGHENGLLHVESCTPPLLIGIRVVACNI